MAKKKEIKSTFAVQITAGQATPAPPLGPILGQNGLNPGDFCSRFNDSTRDKGTDELPVNVTVYKDGTFDLKIKQPTVAGMVKKAAGITKGSANPKKEKIGKITMAQVKEIAERKLPDFNTNDVEAGMKTVIGTAKSLGIEVK